MIETCFQPFYLPSSFAIASGLVCEFPRCFYDGILVRSRFILVGRRNARYQFLEGFLFILLSEARNWGYCRVRMRFPNYVGTE